MRWWTILLVCGVCAGECGGPAYAQDVQVIQAGDVAGTSGVIVQEGMEPAGAFDFRAASSGRVRGWWVPDAFVVDATACWTGCKDRVAAERQRAEGLVGACRDSCEQARQVDAAECREKIDLLARPDSCPFPWAWVLGGTAIGVGIGAVGAALLLR
jgi:hypothetical protein